MRSLSGSNDSSLPYWTNAARSLQHLALVLFAGFPRMQASAKQPASTHQGPSRRSTHVRTRCQPHSSRARVWCPWPPRSGARTSKSPGRRRRGLGCTPPARATTRAPPCSTCPLVHPPQAPTLAQSHARPRRTRTPTILEFNFQEAPALLHAPRESLLLVRVRALYQHPTVSAPTRTDVALNSETRERAVPEKCTEFGQTLRKKYAPKE